ncbi:protein kinase domain-containing protein [Clostridium formicaceticum]|uniref:Serine/threonine-protein kinase B n=1 Tax=Clostridium formicaceticum TaxID=1497 RepID=A0AAC9WG33_9CLOT|nr:protein kinase [Clostridium formicaceticum]AOY76991.1 hypothetical protein BJL90_14680 [Clostridium formicaceticum]ARE87478.1 Serine/threonine-protein kinase B [Clostridium formicaceticum]
METRDKKKFLQHLQKEYKIYNVKEVYPLTVGKSNIFFEGSHLSTNKRVFIKYDRYFCGSITREAQILQLPRLKKSPYFPNVITYEDDVFPFVVFEFIEGMMLSKMLSNAKLRDRLLSKNEQKEKFLLQLLSILKTLHKENIIHRDIHPKNIMVAQNQDKNLDRLILIDFSFAVGINRFPELPYLIHSKRLKLLGIADYRPQIYKWDNQYSIAKIAKQIDKNCDKKFPYIWHEMDSYKEKLVYIYK